MPDESKVSARSAKGCPDYVLGPPHPLTDQWGEGIRPKKEEGTAGECVGTGLTVVCNLVVEYPVKIDNCGEIGEEHVEEGVVTLLVLLVMKSN